MFPLHFGIASLVRPFRKKATESELLSLPRRFKDYEIIHCGKLRATWLAPLRKFFAPDSSSFLTFYVTAKPRVVCDCTRTNALPRQPFSYEGALRRLEIMSSYTRPDKLFSAPLRLEMRTCV
jgi:hypothetical protein